MHVQKRDMSLDFVLNRCCQVFVKRIDSSLKHAHLPLKSIPQAPGESRGSGFVIRDPETLKRYVVTNFHVIANAKTIDLSFPINPVQKIQARLAFADPSYDIALLEIPRCAETDVLEHIELGAAASLTEDQQLYAVGFPLGLTDIQIQRGFKTGWHITPQEVYIQHSAALNPGNSGGCLLIKHAKHRYLVVGINNAIVQSAQSIDFAITSERLQHTFLQWKSAGSIPEHILQPLELGFELQPSNLSLKEYYLRDTNAPKTIQGAVVSVSTTKHSMMQIGDFIFEAHQLQVDDEGYVYSLEFSTRMSLHCYISFLPVNDIIEFELFRNKNKISVSIEVPHRVEFVPGKTARRYQTPFERIPMHIVCGLVFMEYNLNIADEFKKCAVHKPETLYIVNALPEGEVFISQQNSVAAAIKKESCMSVESESIHSLQELKSIVDTTEGDLALAVKDVDNSQHLVVFLQQAIKADHELISAMYPHLFVPSMQEEEERDETSLVEKHMQRKIKEKSAAVTASELEEIEQYLNKAVGII